MKKLTIINASEQDFWKMPNSFIKMIETHFSGWEIRVLKRFEIDLPLLKDAHAIIGLPFPANLIRGNENLEWVHFLAAQVPISWQKLEDKYQITKSRAGGEAVAEHALHLMLKGLRGEEFELTKSWNINNYRVSKLMTESKLGIIGFGNIGEHLIKITLPLFNEVRVLTNRPTAPAHALHHSYREMDLFFKDLDVVVFCTANSIEAQEVFHNPTFYNSLPKDILIINVARAQLLIEKDLVQFLKTNPDARYLTDVTTPEPYPDTGELNLLNNAYISPHIGARFNTIWEKLEKECLEVIKGHDV